MVEGGNARLGTGGRFGRVEVLPYGYGEGPVGTVAAVLAEVVRGHARDARVFAGLPRERVEVYPVDTRVGVRAGQLLGATSAGSERAVDAFIVAVADLHGGAIVATVDTDDLSQLANHATLVAIADIR